MSAVWVTAGPDEGLVWHYGNPNAEQRAIAAGTAVVDLGNREVITITGPDRLDWLHSLTSQHLLELAPGVATTALVLSPTGHIEFVLHGVDDGQTFWAWTEPGSGQPLVDWLSRMVFMKQVEVTRRPDLRVVWVGDQVATTGALAARPSDLGGTELGGTELFVDRDAPLPAGEPAGVWAAEAARIAAGVPRIGVDTDFKTIPNEIDLLGTHLDKGCYRGQETVARVHTLGRPPRRLVRLHLDGSADALPEPGSPVLLDERPVGFVGSSARHYEQGPIALALVKRSTPVDAELVVNAADGTPIAASQEALVDPEVGLHVRPQLR